MEIVNLATNIYAVIRDDFDANVGLIETQEGWVVIDTTTGEEPMREVLSLAGISVEDVKLVLITHVDGDHIGGNTLFDCPIIACQASQDRLAEMENIPKGTFPTEIFDKELKKPFGGFTFELTHVGGHKPDQSYVWMPDQKILFPTDQIFIGRYPVMIHSNIPVWIEELKSLGKWGAETIVSGHGGLAQQEDIDVLIEYIEGTWERVKDHIGQGHNLEDILIDPDFIQHPEWVRQDYFEKNIEVMYDQLMEMD